MADITIPKTAQIAFGQFWAGWTWITKSYNLKIVRYLYYKEAHRDTYTLVVFTREDCYEQFCDDLDFMGKDINDLINGTGKNLLDGSANNHGSDESAGSNS